jgi:hypothetical protein
MTHYILSLSHVGSINLPGSLLSAIRAKSSFSETTPRYSNENCCSIFHVNTLASGGAVSGKYVSILYVKVNRSVIFINS